MKFLGGSLCIIVISSANNDPSIEILIRSNLDDRSRKVNTSVNNFSLSLPLLFFLFNRFHPISRRCSCTLHDPVNNALLAWAENVFNRRVD